jgi:hypothetical protein
VYCHRDLVGEQLVACARRRGVAISVAEWPGGAPRVLRANFPVSAARASLKSAMTIQMPAEIASSVAIALPWGSYARVAYGGRDVPLVLGPALFSHGRWAFQLPCHGVTVDGLSEAELRRVIVEARRGFGFEARVSEFVEFTDGDAELAWSELDANRDGVNGNA